MAEIYNLFGDIFDYLRETYFEADFGYYQNFDLHFLGFSLSQLILGLTFGFILAAIAAVYQKGLLGRFIRALLAAQASDEASARSLSDLGLKRSLAIRSALRHRDSALRKLVRYAGEEREEDDPRKPRMTDDLDYERVRFYIPENLQVRAAVRFNGKGTNLRSLILVVIAALIVAALLIRFLPVVLGWADQLITFFKA